MRRRRSAGPRRGPIGWLGIALLTALSLFVVWQIVQTSAADAFIRKKPGVAATIAPRDPRVPMTLAMLEFQAAGGTVRPQARQAAIEAFARAPLSEEPFFLKGMAALVAGQEAEAERLLIETRRRNPRSRFARLILLDRYLRAGKIDEATNEMTALGNLIPNAGALLLAELGRLARDPVTSRTLERALQRNPAPRDSLLEYLATSGADPDLILRLARKIPPPPQAANAPSPAAAWQAKLVGALVERGDIGRAYQLWRSFSAPGAPERKTGLYDPDLRGLPGTAPFNWFFPGTAAGAADRSANGLQIEYYGRDSAELVAQLLMLPPGRHRLSFVAEGAADGESSKLGWQLICLQSKAQVGELVLRKVDYSPRRLAGIFTVPTKGCSAQWLKLVGAPAEFAKPQSATIRGLRLAREP